MKKFIKLTPDTYTGTTSFHFRALNVEGVFARDDSTGSTIRLTSGGDYWVKETPNQVLETIANALNDE